MRPRAYRLWERLYLSPACPLILSYHVALDQAREARRGASKIGTTGRGIGPAYEDKVARRGLRVGDLLNEVRFGEQLKEVLEYHNFVLTEYYKAPAVDYQQVLDDTLKAGEEIRPLVADVVDLLHRAAWRGEYLI